MKRAMGIGLAVALLAGVAAPRVPAADLVRLTPQTWDRYVPQGKEVDSIYGDFVLRNDRLVAVVANPVEGRNANMTVRDAGGSIIDLTLTGRQNDQLSAFYPGAREHALRFAGVSAQAPAVYEASDLERLFLRGETVTLRCAAEAAEGKPAVEVRYTLADDEPFVLVETTYTNPGDAPLEVELTDAVRADRSFEAVPDGPAPLFWVYDKWFGQAYGVVAEGAQIAKESNRGLALRYVTCLLYTLTLPTICSV
ncbi:MAG: hypothetical protein ACOC46_03260 [Pirellulales bacterium]